MTQADKSSIAASKIQTLSGGINQSGLRDFNERLLLSMIQRTGGLPGSELAKRTSLSPQTVSVILRKLENDALIQKGAPVRGKVGKPSTPMQLNPDGAYSIGLSIGRRGAHLVLMNFIGAIKQERELHYPYPMPQDIFEFLRQGLAEMRDSLSVQQSERIIGIGISMPFEIWSWSTMLDAPEDAFADWKDIDIASDIEKFSGLPVMVLNDATAACHAEHVLGRGHEHRDFAYFFVGAFIGGGIVMNNVVVEGSRKNAGALGALRMNDTGPDGAALIDTASIYTLETMLADAGYDYTRLHKDLESWHTLSDCVVPWVQQTGRHIARAACQACCVIDFEAILIDGAFPDHIRQSILAHAKAELSTLDTRGILTPILKEGTIGAHAREIGAASSLIFNSYFLNVNGGLRPT